MNLPALPFDTTPSHVADAKQNDINTIGKDTKKVGNGLNKIGFDQFHLDKDKRSLMPLP